MIVEQDLIAGPAQEIPDKLYFRIGEVARLAGIKPYVLRFWETEFGGLGPRKSGAGHRLYRRKDVETLLDIRYLLYTERYTIEGAKRKLRETGRLEGEAPVADDAGSPSDPLTDVRDELQAILSLLDAGPVPAVTLTIGERAK